MRAWIANDVSDLRRLQDELGTRLRERARGGDRLDREIGAAAVYAFVNQVLAYNAKAHYEGLRHKFHVSDLFDEHGSLLVCDLPTASLLSLDDFTDLEDPADLRGVTLLALDKQRGQDTLSGDEVVDADLFTTVVRREVHAMQREGESYRPHPLWADIERRVG